MWATKMRLGRGPTNPSFGMTSNLQYNLRRQQITNLWLASYGSYQTSDWHGPVPQTLFWYDNDKDLTGHVLVAGDSE